MRVRYNFDWVRQYRKQKIRKKVTQRQKKQSKKKRMKEKERKSQTETSKKEIIVYSLYLRKQTSLEAAEYWKQ